MPQYQPISLTTATFSVTKDHHGATFFLNRAGGIAIALPAPEAGLEFNFIIGTSPTTAYVFSTNGSANIGVVHVNELDTDTGDDGPYDVDADTISFAANTAVVGDFLHFYCDGTKWYARGQTNADGGVTTATDA